MEEIERQLDQLERDGYLVIEGALSAADTQAIARRLNHERSQGWEDGLNQVGNM